MVYINEFPKFVIGASNMNKYECEDMASKAQIIQIKLKYLIQHPM